MNKTIEASKLRPGMVCLDMGYTNIILVVSASFQLVHLKLLTSVGTIGSCTYPSTSKITIYDPS